MERSQAESSLWADVPSATEEPTRSEERPVREKSKRDQAKAEEPTETEPEKEREADAETAKAEEPSPSETRRESARKAREERRQERAREKQAEAEAAAARAEAEGSEETVRTIVNHEPDVATPEQPADAEARVEEKSDVQELARAIRRRKSQAPPLRRPRKEDPRSGTCSVRGRK